MLLRCILRLRPSYSDWQEARAQLCLAVEAHAMRDLRDRGGRNLPRELCFLTPAIVKSNFLRYNAQVNSLPQPSSGRLLGWPPRSSSACLALRSFFKCLPGREAALYPDANGGGAVFGF